MARLVTATWSPIQALESRVKSRLGSGSITKSSAAPERGHQPAPPASGERRHLVLAQTRGQRGGQRRRVEVGEQAG